MWFCTHFCGLGNFFFLIRTQLQFVCRLSAKDQILSRIIVLIFIGNHTFTCSLRPSITTDTQDVDCDYGICCFLLSYIQLAVKFCLRVNKDERGFIRLLDVSLGLIDKYLSNKYIWNRNVFNNIILSLSSCGVFCLYIMFELCFYFFAFGFDMFVELYTYHVFRSLYFIVKR